MNSRELQRVQTAIKEITELLPRIVDRAQLRELEHELRLLDAEVKQARERIDPGGVFEPPPPESVR